MAIIKSEGYCRVCSLLTLNERLDNDRLKFNIVAPVSITILRGCPLTVRELPPCEFQRKKGSWALDSTSEHLH